MIMRRYDSTEKSKEISGKYLMQAEDFFSFLFFLSFPLYMDFMSRLCLNEKISPSPKDLKYLNRSDFLRTFYYMQKYGPIMFTIN